MCAGTFTEPQYKTLAELIKTLQYTYPSLASADVVGHEHIAPKRKLDPGPHFDWAMLEQALGKPTRAVRAI